MEGILESTIRQSLNDKELIYKGEYEVGDCVFIIPTAPILEGCFFVISKKGNNGYEVLPIYFGSGRAPFILTGVRNDGTMFLLCENKYGAFIARGKEILKEYQKD